MMQTDPHERSKRNAELAFRSGWSRGWNTDPDSPTNQREQYEMTANETSEMTPAELGSRIERELGIIVDQTTIVGWLARDHNPLPRLGDDIRTAVIHWADFLAWYIAEMDRYIDEMEPNTPPEAAA